MKKEEDIVLKEAFKVVKDDFISKLNHTENNVFAAMGVNNIPSNEHHVYLEELTEKYDKMSECFVQLLLDAEDLNTFIVNVLYADKMIEENQKGRLSSFFTGDPMVDIQRIHKLFGKDGLTDGKD